jgi:hypothetical protein
MLQPLYCIDLTFVRDDGCLWPGNEAASSRFGDVGPLERSLPIRKETLQQLFRLRAVHDTRYDLGCWKHFKPWSPEQLERFGHRVRGLLAVIRNELGPEFEVVYIEA